MSTDLFQNYCSSGNLLEAKNLFSSYPNINIGVNNIIEPNHGTKTLADGSYPHIRQPENILRRFPVATTTFYETAANMDVQRVVASATNHLVQTPLIRKYFGGKRTKRRKSRRMIKK